MTIDGIMYALMYKNRKIKAVASADLVKKFPEAVVTFLEGQVVFKWSPRDTLVHDNSSNNRIGHISACTNQGGQCFKYLWSRGDNQFGGVIPSRLAVQFAPNNVVSFLESKLDLLNVSPATPDNKPYGKFF